MRIVVVVVVLVSLVVGMRPQTVEGHTGYWRNTGGGLNLREGPGGQYAVIGTVPSWGVVLAYGHVGNWLKLRVLSSGLVGWAWLWNFHESSYVPPVPESGSGSTGDGNTVSIQTCFWNYWSRTVCAPYWIAKAVYDAAVYWGASYWWLMSVAACESDFVPNAYGWSDTYGIFQFRPYTFYAWGGSNIWSVYDQAWVAAKMFSQGLGYQHWHCYRLIAG